MGFIRKQIRWKLLVDASSVDIQVSACIYHKAANTHF